LILIIELVQQTDKIALKFFLYELKYTQTVSSFKTEHIYENYYKTVRGKNNNFTPYRLKSIGNRSAKLE